MQNNYPYKKRKTIGTKTKKLTVDQKIKKALAKVQSKEVHQMLDAIGQTIPSDWLSPVWPSGFLPSI